MSQKRLKTIVFISISVFLLLLWFLLTRGQTTITPNPKQNFARQMRTTTEGGRVQSKQTSGADTLTRFQKSEFYRTIIDNNLFRPLRWRPPRPTEPYRLIGTIIPTDGKMGAQAILQATAGYKIYTVTRGDTLDADTTVIDIQAKQVTLEKAGEQRTLKLNPRPWLK